MAVVIYKDGEVARVEPRKLQQHLSVGWSLTEDGVTETTTVCETETEMLKAMKILPSVDNVVIGATSVPV